MDPGVLKAAFFIVLAIVGYVVNRSRENAAQPPVDPFPGSGSPSAPPPATASPRTGDTLETEKMRKFFEALGLPATDIPPAPLAPKAAAPPPPRPAAPPPLPQPPRARAAAPAPASRREATDGWDNLGQPTRTSREALGGNLDPGLREVDPHFDRGAMAGAVRAAADQSRADFAAIAGDITRAGNVVPAGRGPVATGHVAPTASLSAAALARQLVTHPDALRRAIILQEVLGPPLALRDDRSHG